MTEAQDLQKLVERALAFAHAAVDEPTTPRILEARTLANRLLPRLGRVKPPAFTLGEASRIVALVSQLRAVLDVLERRLDPEERATFPS